MFIHIKDSYNARTTEGEGEKFINVNHIIHITEWGKRKTNSRVTTLQSRIKLSDGELLDVRETIQELNKMIALANNNRTALK